ncbi:hypothetical protein E2R32_04915 [Rathayibacter toxicus]|uniref:hypothetical protein n=1 Tax=Rathayibacter toxicus TaxID=145458 RepID=UPI0011AFE380|nr:hypothetical protein [Rathayibacter toxicus]QOD09173.1 hypothetical protein AYW78_04970 [Rathayibacter toxicus]QOD11324.1 hypothetical protein BSG36_05155 [Rathayibacter toxicus]QWL25973.1 hypothetical protein E2R32_04915 [Rathayibacter toxicus]QWL28065.1 hypothetical protein E2R33_05155 [Rathayibacter toxicus]
MPTTFSPLRLTGGAFAPHSGHEFEFTSFRNHSGRSGLDTLSDCVLKKIVNDSGNRSTTGSGSSELWKDKQSDVPSPVSVRASVPEAGNPCDVTD